MSSEKRKGLTVDQLDLDKRYDVYQCIHNEERLYENVKFVGLKSIQQKSDYLGAMGSYLELETIFGSRVLISTFGVHLICEHGTRPTYKVFRSWLKEA